MNRTAHLDVSGLHCPVCIGDILDAVSDVPGVTHVSVGAMHEGHSRIAVTSSTSVETVLITAALHGAGFSVHVSSGALDSNPTDRSER